MHVRLFRYSKVSTPSLSYSRHLRIYFLCLHGTPAIFISKLDKVKTWSRLSNLSATSSQSPPIDLQKVSTSKSAGIFKLSPGAGTRLTLRRRSLGVRHLKPSSVLPVKHLNYEGMNIVLFCIENIAVIILCYYYKGAIRNIILINLLGKKNYYFSR